MHYYSTYLAFKRHIIFQNNKYPAVSLYLFAEKKIILLSINNFRLLHHFGQSKCKQIVGLFQQELFLYVENLFSRKESKINQVQMFCEYADLSKKAAYKW